LRISRAVAFALAIAAPLAIFLWLQPMKAHRGVEGGARRRAAAHPSSAEVPPAPQPATAPSPGAEPSRQPAANEPSADGTWRVELDLRGPDGAKLSKGRVSCRSPVRDLGDRESGFFAWRRDAATIPLPACACTLVAESESEESADAIPCADLVSDPTPIDPKTPPPPPLVIRLHARSGIFGRVLGFSVMAGPPPAFPRCGVRWQRLAPGRSTSATQLQLNGHDAKVVDLGRAGQTYYVVHDLEPGRYAIAVRADPGAALETPAEVDVSDTMVRRDLSLATVDATKMLHAVVHGLDPKDLAAVSFLWLGRGLDPVASERTLALSDAPGSFWLAPIEPDARAQLQRVLDGTLGAGETVAVAVTLTRDGAVVDAQPLTSGQHEVRFSCDVSATLRVRLTAKLPDGAPRLDLALAPAAAAALFDVPPAASPLMHAPSDGSAPEAAADPSHPGPQEWNWSGLLPGDFVLVTWGQLHSELRHGEVWWPLARRDVVVKAGEQALELDSPPLHPLEVRFDRARFGTDAHVQVVLRSFPDWPLFAIPDEQGIARFERLPDGDYTVTVVGDMAGERDFTLPGTSELRVEPTRREEH
jgi:hypothetical protein